MIWKGWSSKCETGDNSPVQESGKFLLKSVPKLKGRIWNEKNVSFEESLQSALEDTEKLGISMNKVFDYNVALRAELKSWKLWARVFLALDFILFALVIFAFTLGGCDFIVLRALYMVETELGEFWERRSVIWQTKSHVYYTLTCVYPRVKMVMPIFPIGINRFGITGNFWRSCLRCVRRVLLSTDKYSLHLFVGYNEGLNKIMPPS